MKKYYINLTEQERSQIIHSLIDKKNALMAQGRYTDAVDEVILKMMKAKKPPKPQKLRQRRSLPGLRQR